MRRLDSVLVFSLTVFFLEPETSEFGFILREIGVVRARLVEGGRGRISTQRRRNSLNRFVFLCSDREVSRE